MTELFLFIAYLLGMIIVISKSSFFRLIDLSRLNLIILFLLKVGIAFLILMFYQSYENHKLTSDFQVFYFQAEKLFIQFYNQPKELINLILTSKSNAEEINHQLNQLNYWNRDFDYGLFNDNQTMIRINLFFLFISNKSYAIHLLFFTFIGFIGLTSLIKTISLYDKRIHQFYANGLFLFPTSIIWTSGMLKETLLIGILGILIYLTAKQLKTPKNQYKYLVLILISIYFSVHIKPLFVILSIPSFLFLVINNYTKKHSSLTLFVITHSIFILIFFLIAFITKTDNSSINKDTIKYGYKFDLLRSISYKQDDFFYEAKMKNAESKTELNKLDGTTISLIKTIPDAMQNVFLKPSILDLQNKKFWPFIIENCSLIILLIYLFSIRKNIEWTTPLFLFLIGLTLTSGIFIGILNPIIGTLVRFKAISYLFLYVGIISIIPKKTL